MSEIEEKTDRKFLGVKVSALIKTTAILLFLIVVDEFFGSANRYLGYSLHPFWIVILFVSSQYGTAEGLASCIIATILLYAGNVPEYSDSTTTFEYRANIAFLPLMWVVTAVIMGELRNRFEREKEFFISEYTAAKELAERLATTYEYIKAEKEQLEVRIVAQENTTRSIYNAFKNLDLLNPGKIFLEIKDIVKLSLNPQKYSIFALGNNGFEVVTSVGWEKNNNYSRRFTPDTPIYEFLTKEQKVLCATRTEDEELLGSEGILVGPLVDKQSGKLIGILKIEKLTFNQISENTIKEFTIICEWIGSAYTFAKMYKQSKDNSIFSASSGLFSRKFFEIQKEYLTHLTTMLQRSLFEFTITCNSSKEFQKDLMRFLLEIFPKEALIFQDSSRRFLVLAPLIAAEKAQLMTLKLLDSWREKYPEAEKIQVSVDSLVEPHQAQQKAADQSCEQRSSQV